jgi:cell cycle checkpoint protein
MHLLLHEINKNCEEIEFYLSPNVPYFRITTFGDLHAESSIEITNSSDILISFSCTTATKFRYKFHHIKLLMKTLAISSKVAIRTSKDGLLGLQVMIENIENSNLFVEYFIMPTVANENDT